MSAPLNEKTESIIGSNILDSVEVTIEVTIGTSKMKIEDFRKLGKNDVIELDREIDQLVDICLNGQIIARGQLVTVENKFGVRINEIVNE